MCAMKIQKAETNQTESTALVNLGNFLPVDPSKLMQASSPDSRLPNIKIVNPIEIDPAKGITPAMSYGLVMQDGDAVRPLPAGVMLTVLAARDAVRQIQVEVNGTKIKHNGSPEHSKLDAGYVRHYRAMGQFNKSDAAFQEAMKDKGNWQTGSTYLVAVILPDDSCAIAELPAFKTQASYWFKPLSQAVLSPNKLGCRLLIDNHAVNVRASKSDAQKKYCDPSKFNQFEIVELTVDQLKAIMDAMEVKKADVNAWFDR